MRKKIYMLLLTAAVVLLGILSKINMPEVDGRYFQHLYAKVPEEAKTDKGLECIHPTENSSTVYDSEAVDVTELSTHLPLVVITTQEKIPGKAYYKVDATQTYYTTALDGSTEIMGEMKIMDKKGKMNHISDSPDVWSNMLIRVRGNSSRWFDKSSYAVKTVTSDGGNRNLQIMGMERNHEWVLHGPFLDKSLVRNYVGLNISGSLMDYAPDVRFCEVVINGEYQGLYVMMETVSVGPGRIEIEGINRQKNMTGYVIQFDVSKIIPEDILYNFTRYSRNLKEKSYVKLEFPGPTKLTPSIQDFIEKDISKFEKALYSFDYDTVQYGFQNFVDMEEFADYMILAELFEQQDTGKLSTFYYKDINGKYKPCVWDFNNCSDNFSSNKLDDYHIRNFVSVQAPWYWMMVKEENFTEYVISRYHSLREGILSDKSLISQIDGGVQYLGTAADRNWAVWGYSFDIKNLNNSNKLRPAERNPENYEAAVNQFKNSLLERAHWLDENIEILRQYSHESAVKKFNH